MLQISGLFSAYIPVVDKRDVISFLLGLIFKAVEQCGEKFMRQAFVPFVHKQDTEIVCAVCLQSPGCGVGKVTEFICQALDSVPCLLADIRLIIQCFADSGD